ncbi:MAG: helix-turn-helix domain-containing protein [Actinomycetota bacterium]|nr:helix-turn-helix domain-containing protein [Actinomycetota bacterium]
MAPRSPAHAALGRAIARVRGRREMSQEELAARAGMDRTFVGGIERGEENPSFDKLLRLARVLGLRPSELVAAAEQDERRNS